MRVRAPTSIVGDDPARRHRGVEAQFRGPPHVRSFQDALHAPHECIALIHALTIRNRCSAVRRRTRMVSDGRFTLPACVEYGFELQRQPSPLHRFRANNGLGVRMTAFLRTAALLEAPLEGALSADCVEEPPRLTSADRGCEGNRGGGIRALRLMWRRWASEGG